MKPKRCARLFGKQLNCDSDFNEKLSRLEWANCLTKERFIGELFTALKLINQKAIGILVLFILFCVADHGKGLPGEDYEDSDDDDYENNNDDNDDDERLGDRKPFPFFTPVTQYPPVYCKYTSFFIINFVVADVFLSIFGKNSLYISNST